MKFDIELQKFKTDALRLTYFLVPWDSELMSRPVAQIEKIEVINSKRAIRDFSHFLRWKEEQGIEFSSCRIPENMTRESMLVQQFGYRYMELNYRPELELSRASFEIDKDFKFVTATQSDMSELEHVASSIFRSGRFHDDPKIGPAIGNLRYSRWVRNAFTRSNQEVIKCIREEETVAFFVQEYPEKRHVFWSLIGLTPGKEGKGLGGRVWRSHLAHLHRSGIKRISTSISSRNVPVFNLFVSIGFRFPEPSISFHWHVENSNHDSK